MKWNGTQELTLSSEKLRVIKVCGMTQAETLQHWGGETIMIRNGIRALSVVAAVVMGSAAANAAGIQTYGDVVSNNPGYTLTSDPNGVGYAGLYYDYSASPIALNSITNLSADFQMLQGTISGGAPRFSIFDTTNNLANGAYVYFGTPMGGGTFTDPNPGALQNTGNYASAASSDLRVEINGFNGDSTGNSYITWADFLARDGSALVAFVTLDVDGGFSSTQQAFIDNFVVGGAATATPLPAALPMFLGGAGLVGMALRRRKRKNFAAV
jgi:hypothetical protein